MRFIVLHVNVRIIFPSNGDVFYGSIQVLFNFTPFLLSLIAYLIQKRKSLRARNSVVTKGVFLWQIPIVYNVRNFILWKRLKDVIREKQNGCQNSGKKVMMIDSEIQTLRMYNTFGNSIPNLVLSYNVAIHDIWTRTSLVSSFSMTELYAGFLVLFCFKRSSDSSHCSKANSYFQ